MSREHDCYAGPHQHVGVCQRAGYAAGRADAYDEVQAALTALVAEIDAFDERPRRPARDPAVVEWEAALTEAAPRTDAAADRYWAQHATDIYGADT